MNEFTSHSEQETIAFARDFARTLEPGRVVLLNGDLGAGKTVLARAIIRALCGNEEQDVPSPTFTLLQTYDGLKCDVYHYDLYRLEDPEEIYELSWEDALGDHAITLIEWPERLETLCPARAINIVMTTLSHDQNARHITIKNLQEGTS